VPPQFVPQPPSPSSVQLDSHVEASRKHDLDRQRAPRLASELDLYSPSRAGE
jgi:hypothetical protein